MHWSVSVTQTQRVKALGPACHTNTESQSTGRTGLFYRVKALGLAYHTNAMNQPDTGLDLSYKHIVEAPGRPCHTSVDYVVSDTEFGVYNSNVASYVTLDTTYTGC